MEKTLGVINELKRKGLIRHYAIGGGMAAVFYLEPFATYDLDIFYIPAEGEHLLSPLPRLYDYLRKRHYRPEKEHIAIEGVPVQFLPAYGKLIEEAILRAKTIRYGSVVTKVFSIEHLLAIMIQTGRPKDTARIIQILQDVKIDAKRLQDILSKHGLREKFRKYRGHLLEKD